MRTACHKEEWLELGLLPAIRHEPVIRELNRIPTITLDGTTCSARAIVKAQVCAAMRDEVRCDIPPRSAMRPLPSILDPSFRYVPSDVTSVEATWRRAGWRPTTEDERRARQRSSAKHMLDDIGIGDLRCRWAGCALGRALRAA
jgi:hypothetical protein